MGALEDVFVRALLVFATPEAINNVLSDPRTVAVLLGALIAICGGVLGVYLLLRGMALTSDAISHTVLLGIVVAFLVMTGMLGMAPDLSSPLLIVGAALAGVLTVVLTELIERSGLVKQDAALGLVFPLLFAVAVILISRYVDNVHLDTDSVLLGEIGMAWANTNSYCFEGCESVTITPDDPRAVISRQCINCRTLNISPRNPAAEFDEVCVNCGTYTPAQAYQAGLTTTAPALVFWPKSLTVMGLLTLVTVGFVLLLYKELKLSTFDAALAAALGFRPGAIHYALMVLVSLVAVGAFDAVGSILVVAFFIIPPAAAYLLTDRLGVMLLLSPAIGAVGAYFGYDLARGSLFGLVQISDVLGALNRVLGTQFTTQWNSSISASMALMMFLLFVVALVVSPRYGLVSVSLRRAVMRRQFEDHVVLGHLYRHADGAADSDELAVATLHEHLRWPRGRMQRALLRLRAWGWIQIDAGTAHLTPQGRQQVEAFRHQHLL